MEQCTTFRRLARGLASAWLAGSATASFAAAAAGNPLPEAARAAIEKLVQAQTAGLPGKAATRFSPSAAALPPCEDFDAFLPTGARAWGRVSIGLRCRGDKPWTRFVAAHVTVTGSYFVAARTIEPGEALAAADVGQRSGDLSTLPRTVVTDAAALRGVTSAQRIAAGAPLRKELLRGQVVIQQGQTVQLIAQGPGYAISTEGQAMTQAEAGAGVKARTRDGRLLSGVADEEGRIQLAR